MFAQVRLYLMVAAALMFAAVLAMALWYRGQAISADARNQVLQIELSDAISANQKAQKAIEDLKKQSEIDGKLAADLAEKNRELVDALAEKDAELAELEKNDESVRDFLAIPVPPAVSGMYGH